MSAASADLVVTDLHKAFGRHRVLTGLDLTVPVGTVTAVLGASGSGKTTLLRVVVGFERPDRGSIAMGGTILDDGDRHVRPESRGIGYVSQEGSLFPHLSVEANIAFGLPRRQRGGPRVHELIDTVGLTGFDRRYPHQLSGGQQQRVALARALAVGSKVVLLDEPFNTLDANLRATVRADVRAILHEAGATAILVTHDQDEALLMADLVAVMRDGTIAQLASPSDLYDYPVDADVARFVGDANVIEGTAAGEIVHTAFGALTMRRGQGVVARSGASVLIRPEQIEVQFGPGGAGVPGEVLSADFHGSDTVIQIAPRHEQLTSPIVARILGNVRLAPGEAVTMRATGTVWVWPPDRTARQEDEHDESFADENGR